MYVGWGRPGEGRGKGEDRGDRYLEIHSFFPGREEVELDPCGDGKGWGGAREQALLGWGGEGMGMAALPWKPGAGAPRGPGIY